MKFLRNAVLAAVFVSSLIPSIVFAIALPSSNTGAFGDTQGVQNANGSLTIDNQNISRSNISSAAKIQPPKEPSFWQKVKGCASLKVVSCGQMADSVANNVPGTDWLMNHWYVPGVIGIAAGATALGAIVTGVGVGVAFKAGIINVGFGVGWKFVSDVEGSLNKGKNFKESIKSSIKNVNFENYFPVVAQSYSTGALFPYSSNSTKSYKYSRILAESLTIGSVTTGFAAWDMLRNDRSLDPLLLAGIFVTASLGNAAVRSRKNIPGVKPDGFVKEKITSKAAIEAHKRGAVKFMEEAINAETKYIKENYQPEGKK